MITVTDLIEKLKAFPANAIVKAYEGEIVGFVIVDENNEQLGFIPDGQQHNNLLYP